MSKRLSSKDFLKLAENFWEAGPKVKYQNPDVWIAYLIKRALMEKEEEMNSKK